MAVPSSGEISLSKVLREIQYCDFVGVDGVGGYNSTGSVATNISLSALDTNSSIRTADTNRGDGSAPYALSEWYGYSDLVPNTVYVNASMSEAVSENPTYRVQFISSTTRTVFLYPPSDSASNGTVVLAANGVVEVRVDRWSPDSTVQDETPVQWFSSYYACSPVGAANPDETRTFYYGDTLYAESKSYSNVEVGSSFRVIITEG